MLPSDNTEWPPPGLRAYYAQVARLAAWYGDDTGDLYPGRLDYGTAPSGSGGNWREWFRRGAGTTRYSTGSTGAMHVPVAADVARTSADLLFGEPPAIEVSDDPQAQDRLEQLLDEMGYRAMLTEGGELCAALSGLYWRVTWDPQVVRDRPILTWMQPDGAIPEWRWGILQAVTFWAELPEPPDRPNTGTWRHLERHSLGKVEHGLYAGDATSLGRRHPLADHPAVSGIDVTDGDTITLQPGIPLTAGYIPNMRPNRQLRTSPLGRADISGMEKPDGPLAGIDRAWSSWMQDLDLGRARAVVPDEYLRDLGPGAGAAFDIDRAVYTGLRMPPSTNPITLMQFDIRVDEHQRTIMELLSTVVRGAGYSLGSFGLAAADAPAITATEQRARNALSMTTREKKTGYWTPEIQKMLACLLAVDSITFGGPGLKTDIEVEFPAAVAEDPERVATTVNLLFQAQAASTATRVSAVHPDWDDDRVAVEVAAIQAEQSIAVPDPIGAGETLGAPGAGTETDGLGEADQEDGGTPSADLA